MEYQTVWEMQIALGYVLLDSTARLLRRHQRRTPAADLTYSAPKALVYRQLSTRSIIPSRMIETSSLAQLKLYVPSPPTVSMESERNVPQERMEIRRA